MPNWSAYDNVRIKGPAPHIDPMHPDYGASPSATAAANIAAINASMAAAKLADARVLLTAGNFTINSPLLITATQFKSISLAGIGVSQTTVSLAASSNCNMLEWLSTLAYDIENFTLENLSFAGNSTNQTTGHILALDHLAKARITNVELSDAKGSCISATSTNDIKFTNVTSSGATANPVVRLVSCDGLTAVNFYIYKYSGTAGTGLQVSGGSESAFANLVVDGGSLDVAISLSNTSRMSVSGFWAGAYSAYGLYVTGASHYNSFIGGRLYGRGTVQATGGAINVIDSASNNIFSGDHLDGDVGYGIQIQGTATGNRFFLNDLSTIDDTTKRVSDTSSGTNRVGLNSGYITENSGTGTIASGATTAVVTHGLSVTPTLDDISIVFGEQGTSDWGRWWVSNITSTQFTLNVSVDPGASNLDFGWRAVAL